MKPDDGEGDMPMDVFDKLRKADGLSDADHAILDYVLDNPDRVAGLTSRGLAELTHTSSSSVVRFCRKLGFEGYNDFIINIADTLKRTNPGTTRVTAAESALSASAKTAELLLTAVAETRRTMDLGALERASDLLAAAREIDVCGNGPNEAIAQHATHMLVRTGHLASLRSDTDYLVFFSALVPADHAAIVISRGATDRSVVETLTALRERGVPSVLVTASLTSPGAEIATCVLTAYYGEFGVTGEMVFAASATYLLDALATMLLSRGIEQSRAIWDETYEALSDRVNHNDGWSRDDMSHL